jgi:hypothetical protein
MFSLQGSNAAAAARAAPLAGLFVGGTGSTTGAGGAFTFVTGNGGNTTGAGSGAGLGGGFNIYGGIGGNASGIGSGGGNGGTFTFTAGLAGNAGFGGVGGHGGDINLTSGNGGNGNSSLEGAGGSILLTAGRSGTGSFQSGAGAQALIGGGAIGAGGAIQFIAGSGPGGGGGFTINTGDATSTNSAGGFLFTGGVASSSTNNAVGGSFTVIGGAASSTNSTVWGGSIALTGGSGGTGTQTNGTGGSITLNGGAAGQAGGAVGNVLLATQRGAVGIGTTTPWGMLALSANDGRTFSGNNLFLIASSTSNSTTTLLALDNNGQLSLPTVNSALSIGGVYSGGSIVGGSGVEIDAANSRISGFSSGNQNWLLTQGGAVQVGLGGYYGFSNATNLVSGCCDLKIGRNAAGVLEVNSGTAGVLGNLVANRIGLGTTTPYAQLSILATSTNGIGSPTTLFAIASTSGGISTSTLFSVNNTGAITTPLGTLGSGYVGVSNGQLYSFASTSLTAASSTLLGDFNTFSNLQSFNGGLTAYASSTIGDGTQVGGLTINGGATSTGFINVVSSAGYQINGVSALTGSTTKNNYFFGNATTSPDILLGQFNYAIGYGAMMNATNTSFLNNFAVGKFALMGSATAQNTGNSNVAIGNSALMVNTTGRDNNALGISTLLANTTGQSNNALGATALTANTTGSFNNAFGSGALNSNTTGRNNVAIGTSALLGNTTGVSNIGIGINAGRNITSGYSNVMLGENTQTGGGITTGFGNIGLGPNVFFASTTANSQLNIGNILFGTLPATTTGFRLPTSGTIGIGTSTPFGKLAISLNDQDSSFYNNAFLISSSTASATSSLFVVQNNGFVGIGSSTPSATFSLLSANGATDNNAPLAGLMIGGTGGNTASNSFGGTGGGFTIRAGAGGINSGSFFGGYGGAINLIAGAGGANSNFTASAAGWGGNVNISGGNGGDYTGSGGSQGGGGGNVTITGGAVGQKGNGFDGLSGGDISLAGGSNQSGTGYGAYVKIGGSQFGSLAGGISFAAGSSTAGGGGFAFTGGNSMSSGSGGAFVFTGGVASSSTNGNTGGAFTIVGGAASSTNSTVWGGSIALTGGSGGTGTQTVGTGGSVTLNGGAAGIAGGSVGNVILANLRGNVGVGTTSPFAKFSIAANNGDTNQNLFAISSSTANSTSTLLRFFSMNNGGFPSWQLALSQSDSIFAVGGENTGNGMVSGVDIRGSSSAVDSFTAGSRKTTQDSTGFSLASDVAVRFLDNANLSVGNVDLRLSRVAPGTLGVGAWDTAGSFNGTLLAERIGLGTTTPYAQLSVVATSTNGIGAPRTLFAVASTTGGNSTTTLFSISNTGAISAASGNLTINSSGVINTADAANQNTPQIRALNDGVTGLVFRGNNQNTVGVALGGSDAFNFAPNYFTGYNGSVIGWSATTNGADWAAVPDTGFSRIGAGNKVALGNGTLGDYSGTLALGHIGIGTSTPFTQLSIVPNSGTISQASSISTGLTSPYSVFVQGRYAYVADQANGLIIFDVSNAAAPVKVGSNTGGMNQAQSIYVQGRYAYVGDVGSTHSVVIFDVSNPSVPVKVGAITSIVFQPYSVYVQGRYAYIADHDGLFFIYDVSNPTAPVLVGSIYVGNLGPNSLYVQGHYAYMVDFQSELDVIDVSNPAAPSLTSVTSSGLGIPVSIYVQGRYAYVADVNNGLVTFDISNPASPVHVSTNATGLTTAYSVYAQGRNAYVVDRNGALVTFDISNPASPSYVSSIAGSLDNPYTVFVQGRYAYVASVFSSSLVTFDLGGSYISQLEAGGIQAGSLSLDNNLQALDGEFSGGLTVGHNLNVGGSFSLSASTYNATTTAGQNFSIFSLGIASSTNPIFNALYNGKVGLGTSTPWAKLSISLNSGDTSQYAFMIASSTASATTTLFSVSNTGNATLLGNLTVASCTGCSVGATAASSTLLSDSNTFSGFNTFTKFVNLNPNLNSTSTLITLGGRSFLNASSSATIGNLFLGLDSGSQITSGLRNTAVGYQALSVATSSSNNTAFGYGALDTTFSAGMGSRNTGIGSNVLGGGGIAGNDNTGLGNNALASGNIDGSFNIGLGSLAFGGGAVSGSGNIGIGYKTVGGQDLQGSNNIALGYQAGYRLSSGYSNILLGAHDSTASAGQISTGYGNIGLGNELYFQDPAANNQLNIGNILFGTLPATSTGFQLPTAGTIGIGTSTPFAKLAISLNNGDNSFYNNAFLISSSTGSATTTLFSISNTGQIILNLNSSTSTLIVSGNSPLLVTSGTNIGVGTNALGSNSGVLNSAVGVGALETNSGHFNAALGYGAMSNNTGNSNVGIGYTTLQKSGAANNTAVGYQSLSNAIGVTGGDNVAIGFNAFNVVSSGVDNVGIGSSVGGSLGTGSFNTLLGYEAGAGTNGFDDTSVGSRAGVGLNHGYGNTFLGSFGGGSASNGITNGVNNIGVGAYAYFPSDTNNQLNIGNILFGTLPATTTGYRYATSGTIGIGTSTPFGKLAISLNDQDSSFFNNAFLIASSTGSATSTLFSVSNAGNATVLGNLTVASCTGCSVGATAASSTLLGDFNTFANLQRFSGGFMALASSTIGDGTQVGGLTINGGATSTGFFNVVSSAGYQINGVSAVIGSTTKNNYYFGGATTSIDNNLGTFNYAIGFGAMTNATNTSFANNFAVGKNALLGSTTAQNTGTNNIAIGNSALKSNTSGGSNNAFGSSALAANTTGSNNNAFGGSALLSNTTGANNNAIGGLSLFVNTTGSNNNALGLQALGTNSTGSSNNAFGLGSLTANTTGSNNNAFGASALGSNTTGANNTGIGLKAGVNITSGYSNIMIGDNTQITGGITSGNSNIGIGANVFFAEPDRQPTAQHRQYSFRHIASDFDRLPASNVRHHRHRHFNSFRQTRDLTQRPRFIFLQQCILDFFVHRLGNHYALLCIKYWNRQPQPKRDNDSVYVGWSVTSHGRCRHQWKPRPWFRRHCNPEFYGTKHSHWLPSITKS